MLGNMPSWVRLYSLFVVGAITPAVPRTPRRIYLIRFRSVFLRRCLASFTNFSFDVRSVPSRAPARASVRNRSSAIRTECSLEDPCNCASMSGISASFSFVGMWTFYLHRDSALLIQTYRQTSVGVEIVGHRVPTDICAANELIGHGHDERRSPIAPLLIVDDLYDGLAGC